MIFAFDLDGTICENKTGDLTYATVLPFPAAIAVLKDLKSQGHTIILHTGRHMKTCGGNQGQILAKQGKVLLDWLEKWDIPYDEIWWSKPHADLFIDDAVHKHTDWASSIEAINERIRKGPRGPENP
jgi:capsule biosynthesis phosphatase